MLTEHIVIIGGGVSGLFTFCKLVDIKIDQDNLLPIQVTIIEKNECLGEGLAYKLDYDSHLLNTAAGLFSSMEDENFCLNNQPSFLKWIRQNIDTWASYYPNLNIEEINKNAYLPRGLVGIYLRNVVDFYFNHAIKYGVITTILHQEVVDLTRVNNEKWEVRLKDNKAISCDFAILALGGFFKDPFERLKKYKNYHSTTQSFKNKEKQLLKEESIGIIGTKLSAIDICNILMEFGYNGKIYMASRSGFLPSVKNVHYLYKPKILTMNCIRNLTGNFVKKLKLNDFINLLKSEIEFSSGKPINWNKIFSKKSFKLSWLKWQTALAEKENVLWSSVLASVDDVVIASWNLLSEKDRNLFKKDFAFFWDLYRFSMPLDIAYKLKNLIEQKK